MERRSFFGWIGKVALVIGAGNIIGHSEVPDFMPDIQPNPGKIGERRMRMNGRACHDFRMISSDRSMMLDREIFES